MSPQRNGIDRRHVSQQPSLDRLDGNAELNAPREGEGLASYARSERLFQHGNVPSVRVSQNKRLIDGLPIAGPFKIPEHDRKRPNQLRDTSHVTDEYLCVNRYQSAN